jgi:phosphatidylserine decarboxylase
MSSSINVYNRKQGSMFAEKVLGEFAMKCAYGNPASAWFTSNFLVRKNISQAMGLFYDSPFSKPLISSFVKDFDINISESARGISEFHSFNDFFARHLRDEARPVEQNPNSVTSPGDGRLLVFPVINNDTVSFAKWAPIRLLDLFSGNSKLTREFSGGSCAILRLCPTDYHRFHFPASGTPGETQEIKGLLHSVNPCALERKIPVYCLNKRTLCEFQSDTFGKIAILEIGALGVGSIVQTYETGKKLPKGAEKGFFKFGGSTTILFFQPHQIQFDSDLIEKSSHGIETLVRMGEQIASGTQKS